MTKTSLTILWLAAAGLGGSVAWVKMNQSHQAEATTSRARGETLFKTFPAPQIGRISIKSAKDKVTLVKGDNGWTVAERGDYPADAKRVNELLENLEDVKITQCIQAGPTYDKRFGMDPVADTPEEHGIQIIFSAANDTQLASVTLGKTLESNSGGLFGMGGGITGRFVRNRAEPDAVYVTSETFPRVVATPKDWLREDFIAIEKVKSIAVTMPNKKDFKPWKLVRPDEVSEFKLAGAAKDEKLDAPTITPLKSLFSYARFEDVAPKAALKELEKSPDLHVVTIETVEGFTYTVRFAPQKADDKKKDGPAPASAAQNYLLTVKVSAKIPKERKKAKDEKKEDAKKLDETFATRTKELGEKLEKEKQLEGRVFEVTRWPIEALLKNRSQLLAKTTAPAGPGAMRPSPGMRPQPGRPIQAVTPAIPIPPMLPDKTKPKPAPKPPVKPKPAAPKDKPTPDSTPAVKPKPAPAKPKPTPAPAKTAAPKPKPQPAPAKPAPAPKPPVKPAPAGADKPAPPKQPAAAKPAEPKPGDAKTPANQPDAAPKSN